MHYIILSIHQDTYRPPHTLSIFHEVYQPLQVHSPMCHLSENKTRMHKRFPSSKDLVLSLSLSLFLYLTLLCSTLIWEGTLNLLYLSFWEINLGIEGSITRDSHNVWTFWSSLSYKTRLLAIGPYKTRLHISNQLNFSPHRVKLESAHLLIWKLLALEEGLCGP